MKLNTTFEEIIQLTKTPIELVYIWLDFRPEISARGREEISKALENHC
jgi:hypothetical protein